jgi:hypothetical protein
MYNIGSVISNNDVLCLHILGKGNLPSANKPKELLKAR